MEERGGIIDRRCAFAPQLLLLLLVSWITVVGAWKKDEFKRCDQTSYCKEARARPLRTSDLHVSDVTVANGRVRALLLSDNQEPPLSLQITTYEGGIVRFKIKEEVIAAGRQKRFEVPNVLLDSVEEKKLWIQRVTAKDGASVVALDGFEVVLEHKPFKLVVKAGKDVLLSVNSKGLFHYEQMKERHEEDDWDETFRSHTDTRPNGPQSVSFDVVFHGAEHVYGLPERATSLALGPTKGPGLYSEPYRLFNLDVFEYITESPFGLYGAVPLMFSHSEERTIGFFWLNAAEMSVDVMAEGWDEEQGDVGKVVNTHWIAESGIFDTFVFVGPGPKDVIRQYTSLTGTSAMPQFFATAYHQCRWNYKDEADVAAVDAGFDEHDIPYDVIWLDIEHTEDKKYFTWDRGLFPHPKEMQDKIAAKGRHMVTIVDPHIKRDNGFAVHREATSKGYYVKDKHRRDYEGWCWPGSSSYLDMLDPEVRAWWADKFSLSSYAGSTPILYIWNDMNEPSVFNGPEATMHRDAIHFGDVEHRDVHNAYGLYFHMASADGLLKRGEYNDRPFVLSRAFFAGSQRVGPIWTGDNTADWDHLRASIPMTLTLGLAGIAFTGSDVGGFFGNPEPELLTRWYQLGAYHPFFRGHAHLDTKRREPWIFGEPYTSQIREAIHTRYALLPYFYTLFREAYVTGVPLVRPLWMEYPHDPESFSIDDEFLLGRDLLVHGVFAEGVTSEDVYFPGSESWYNTRTGAPYAGDQTVKVPVTPDAVPAFQRAGSIIPRKDRFRRSSTQMEFDPYTLVVALNSTYGAEGELYIDDGKSYEFKDGAFIHRMFTFADGHISSTSLAPSKAGNKEFTSPCVVERVILLGLQSKDMKTHRVLIEADGTRVTTEMGPMLLRNGVGGNALTLRLPRVPISEDWSIKVL